VKKIESLMDRYSGIRRARGDGNCFYRSFVFGYLESLLISQNCEEKER
jgi:ubiquitin thioesterase protein OTUB1